MVLSAPLLHSLCEILQIMNFWKGNTWRVTRKKIHQKVDNLASYGPLKYAWFRVQHLLEEKMEGIYNADF